MFVGHALLAFALAALLAEWRGWPGHRALALGVVAGAFAAIPDVDVLYGLVAMDPSRLLVGADVRPEEFWGAADGVHRSMTHSLTVAVVAGPAFGLWARRSSRGEDARGTGRRAGSRGPDRRTVASRALALGALAALAIAATIDAGPVGALVMTAFALAGLGVAALSRWYTDLSARVVALAAVAGLASHPWGDLLTGRPPRLLYPLDVVLVTDRVVLAGDPTLHLLATFALELAIVGLAATVLARSLGCSPRGLVGRRAALGAVYGVAALALPAPTIHVSYEFVCSILTVGVVCGVSRSSTPLVGESGLRTRLRANPTASLGTVFTMLAGIAVALASYAVVYVTVG